MCMMQYRIKRAIGINSLYNILISGITHYVKDLHLIVGSGTSARETSKRLVAISGASELSPESNNSEPDDSSGDGSSGGKTVNVLLR